MTVNVEFHSTNLPQTGQLRRRSTDADDLCRHGRNRLGRTAGGQDMYQNQTQQRRQDTLRTL